MKKNVKGLLLITGTTSGVGLNTLKPLLRFGWEVIAINRSNRRAVEIAQQNLTESEIKNIHFIEIDLSDLDDVRNGCNENEVILVPKNIENKGFFEKFFQLFS